MRIRIFGLGEIGLRVARNAVNRGHDVRGIEINAERRAFVAAFFSSIRNANGARMQIADWSAPGTFDLTIVSVPTFDPDIGLRNDAVLQLLEQTAPTLSVGEVVSIESTIPPGSTAGCIRDVLEAGSGLKAGRDFYLVCSPERIDTTTAEEVSKIARVVGGVTPSCGEAGRAAYSQLVDEVHLVENSTVAEFSKLLENTYRLVNIAFVNEFSALVESYGLDAHSVITAAQSKPFGFMAFWPSIAAGGHCIPAAGRCVSEISSRAEVPVSIVDACVALNDSGPSRTRERLEALQAQRVLIVGLGYKSRTMQFTESPALKLATHLTNQGFGVVLSDLARPPDLDPRLPFVQISNLEGRFDATIVASADVGYSAALRRIEPGYVLDLAGSPRAYLQLSAQKVS